MKMGIYLEDLNFVNEAVGHFDQHPESGMFFDDNHDRLALRWGPDNDCVKVFRLDDELMFINNCLSPFKRKTIIKNMGGEVIREVEQF